MLITRETDYALRIIRALSDGQQRSIEEICRLEATPKQFAYRIIKKLEKMGWILIFRGVEGGCRLNVDLHNVNLYQLIEGMGTDKGISACMQSGYECTRKAVCDDICLIQKGLVKIQENLNNELKGHNIHSLIFGN